MSIDINAFRVIANQSPDKFVYAQGDTLKASHSDTSHGAHTYRARRTTSRTSRSWTSSRIRSVHVRRTSRPFLTKYYLNAE